MSQTNQQTSETLRAQALDSLEHTPYFVWPMAAALTNDPDNISTADSRRMLNLLELALDNAAFTRLTEDIAKASVPERRFAFLVKERQYDEALQIITEINLNNPEKSIYFADQIRFLKKLILNASKSASKS
ncbi:MAG: hypothetical protein K2H47_12920 [Muribaculaceae bacterium]|nr:hypothetical protein [Muribaculaceae bacterium]